MVREGFKQTEIGLIPEDWEVKNMADICWVNQGLQIEILKRKALPTLNSKKYITIQFLNDGKEIEYVDDYSLSVVCSPNDILMTRTGNTGIVVTNVEGVFHNNFFKINYDIKKVVRLYLLYFLRFPTTQKIILSKAGTSTIPDLNHNDFYTIQIPLPPLPEQKAIAEALNDADAWIENLEKLIAKKRLIKQGAMQDLLSPKEGWEVKKLGEVAEIIIGLTYSPNDVRDYGTLVLRSSNVQNNKLAFANNVFVDMSLPERVIVKEIDLLVCVRNGSKQLIGKCALIDSKTEGQAFGAFMAVVRSEYNKYIFQYFQTNQIQSQIDENLGATINQLTNKNLKEFEIWFPKSLSEQTRIATILSDMDNEIESLENKLGKARQIKQGMMQELLTGRVRLV